MEAQKKQQEDMQIRRKLKIDNRMYRLDQKSEVEAQRQMKKDLDYMNKHESVKMTKAMKSYLQGKMEKSRSETVIPSNQEVSRSKNRRFLILKKDEVTAKVGDLHTSSPNRNEDAGSVRSGSRTSVGEMG